MRAGETSGEVVEALLERWSPAGSRRWLQVAAGGRWEDARGVDMPADPDAARALVRDAGPPGADVAAEFEWLAHPLVFVGARRRPGGGDDGAAFEEAVTGLAAREPAGPAEALARLAGGPPESPGHVELGAANAWQSVGPLRLWSAGEGAPGPTAGLLRDRSDLVRCVAPVALEVAFDGPRPCWIGIEVSERTRDGHALLPARLEALLARLFSA